MRYAKTGEYQKGHGTKQRRALRREPGSGIDHFRTNAKRRRPQKCGRRRLLYKRSLMEYAPLIPGENRGQNRLQPIFLFLHLL